MLTTIDIVIPVLNEQAALPICIEKLTDYCKNNLKEYSTQIVIADNGSTDLTQKVAKQLSEQYSNVSYLHIPVRGRGLALRTSWLNSKADLVGYMDVDLSTGLDALPKLVGAIADGRYDIGIGGRLSPSSETNRSYRREIISRVYNTIIKLLFFVPFNDAQCGFKFLTKQAAQTIVPCIKNNHWFFDTELLLIACKRGYKVVETPVTWVEDKDTRVKIFKTVLEDLSGLLRLRLGGIPKV